MEQADPASLPVVDLRYPPMWAQRAPRCEQAKAYQQVAGRERNAPAVWRRPVEARTRPTQHSQEQQHLETGGHALHADLAKPVLVLRAVNAVPWPEQPWVGAGEAWGRSPATHAHTRKPKYLGPEHSRRKHALVPAASHAPP